EEVRRGVQEVGQVSEQLAQIIGQVQALTPQFETVNEGMQSQSTGAQQISEALAQLTESAQQTVDSLHQSSIVMDQLNSTAHDLRTSTWRFNLNAAWPARTFDALCMRFILFQIGRDRYALSASSIIEVLPLMNLKRV